MKLILWVVLMILSVGFGLFIYYDPGYALFSYGNTSIEMPLWLSLVGILALVFVLFYAVYFFQSMIGCIHWLEHWRRRLRARRAKSYISKGLFNFSEGHFLAAENNMVKAAKLSDTPLVYYLIAARAAQAQEAHTRRDRYLKSAHALARETDLAVSLTQAELQFKQRQYEQCLATLKALSEKSENHVQILKWKYKVYLALKDFQALNRILPLLKKNKVLGKATLNALEHQVFSARLHAACDQGHLEQVLGLWDKAPTSLRSDPVCVAQYAEVLMAFEENVEAEKILYILLKKNWDEKLVTLYGLVKGADLKKQLAFSEGFLRTHQNNATLLLTLGRLAMANQLWGKAKDYLQASVHIQPLPESYATLARLLQQLGETPESERCYQKGLLLAVGL